MIEQYIVVWNTDNSVPCNYIKSVYSNVQHEEETIFIGRAHMIVDYVIKVVILVILWVYLQCVPFLYESTTNL